jgi:hypothetical protein
LTPASPACTQAAPNWERVAQPVEHLTFNQRVSGSNPDALTTKTQPFVKRFELGASQKPNWEAHGKHRVILADAQTLLRLFIVRMINFSTTGWKSEIAVISRTMPIWHPITVER